MMNPSMLTTKGPSTFRYLKCDEAFYYRCAWNPMCKEKWYIDGGCSRHMIGKVLEDLSWQGAMENDLAISLPIE